MKRTIPTLLTVCFCAGLALIEWSPGKAATAGTTSAQPANPIPYVPTRHDVVRDLLWLADVGTNDTVYDLGSGDGRVVIAAVRDFGARRAVGIEIDPKLVQQSRERAAQAGLGDRAQLIHGDLFTNGISQATVVVLYLGHGANLDLRARLVRTLKPGARVVSHQFGMGEWPADKLLDVRTILLGMYGEMFIEFRTNPDVPDFDGTGSRASHDVLSMWMIPAPVAGVWRGKVAGAPGEGELEVTLHQRLSGVMGSYRLQGTTNLTGAVQADLWGDHVRFHCSSLGAPMWFDGRVKGDTMTGTLWAPRGDQTRELPWVGRRDAADLSGTWEWTGPSNAPVQLRIEQRDGRLAATYVDESRKIWGGGTKPIPVTDFYDFGGGFYFTLLLGLEGSSMTRGSRRMGPEDGWLIGEAVAQGAVLSGTIAFYPYRHEGIGLPDLARTPAPAAKAAPQSGRHDWQARRVAR